MNLVCLLGIMTTVLMAGNKRIYFFSRLVVPSLSFSTRTVTRLTATASSLLQDPSLITNFGGEAPGTFEVRDPGSPDTVLAEVREMGKLDAQAAIQRSFDALPKWRDETTAAYRASLLQKWSCLMKENSKDLATLMTLESGKPLSESYGEVNYAASFLDYYASEATRPTGAGGGFITPSSFATPSGAPRGVMMAIQQAVGVTALITPWNFPSAMIARKCGPALAAGCVCVVKPSELTPLSAIAMKALADRAGIPESVFQLV
jgi:succinate-semialdehyde dehydrogenase/glutarate-semialdehyde dehydrogenase